MREAGCFCLLIGLLMLLPLWAQSAVDPQVFRHASAPPDVPVADLAFDAVEEQELTWTYYLNGDYDQNGEVNISDITPIGQHFGKTSAHLDWHTARVADGDGNGEVNIADLTPIGNSFGSRVTHFELYSADNEAGPFEPATPFNPPQLRVTELADTPLPVGGGPREFRHRIAYPVVGHYYCVVASDGAETAVVHSNVQRFDPLNQPPIASFSIDTTGERMTGTTVHFNAGSSSDPDGTIVEYAWDLTGTGAFFSVGTANQLNYQYDQPGDYAPTLRVTDNQGATSITSFDEPQLFISNGVAEVSTLVSAGNAATYLSCALVDWVPTIAYIQYDVTSDLHYIRASNQEATSWQAPVLVDTECQQPSLAQLSGLPIIAYSKDGLSYLRGNDVAGTSWQPSVTVAPHPSPVSSRGVRPCLSLINGIPHIADSSAFMLGPGNVWLTNPFDTLGDSWDTSVLVSDGTNGGVMPTLIEFDNLLPGIVFMREVGPNEYDIWYRRSLTSDPGGLWHALSQVTTENARLGAGRSMVAVSWAPGVEQVPLVVYWSLTDNMLRSVTGISSDGSNWGGVVDIAPATDTGSNFSLAKIDRQPVVVYFDGATNELKLVWASSPLAPLWGEPHILDSGASFASPSLIELNNWPAVAYQDATAKDLKFVVVRPD